MRTYATGALSLLAAVLVVALDHDRHWSWLLLAWGLFIGILGVVGSFAIGRATGVGKERWDAYPSFVLLSVAVAVLAAGLSIGWLDVAFALYVAIANFALPLALLPRLRPPAAHACGSEPACGATACATCPLASRA